MLHRAAASLLPLLAAGAALAQPLPESRAVDAFVAPLALTPATPAEIEATCTQRLARAAALRATLEAETGPATIARTFRRYDDLAVVLNAAGNDATLLGEVAPDEPRRDAARTCRARVNDAGTAIRLSRPIYDRLAAIDAMRADATSKLLLSRALLAYRNAGVGGDPATRARVEALQSRISAQGIQFDANIANGRKTITATPAELAGLPADYIAAHRPDAAGAIAITTDTPDYVPVMTYAASDALRHRLSDANLTRAFPTNDAVLADLFAQRDALAKTLGRANFAELALADKMIDTPARAQALLEEIAAAAKPAADRDSARLLARLKRIDPNAIALNGWSTGYLTQLVRKEDYAVDPQEVRRYFPYEKVRDGLFQLTRDLFAVDIRSWKTALWHPDAEAYEMTENGQVVGRFFLDAHPRPGKYSHANVVLIRAGLAGRNLPVGALVVNFPKGGYATGLMEHQDVETFLHEYGHLLHVLFAGRQQWNAASSFNVEWDFVESPSTMLENWVWDYDTLRRFAVDEQGRTIPAELVAKMNRARYFGEAFGDMRQLGLANASLAFHLGPPPADLTLAMHTAYDRYAPVPLTPNTHMQDAFTHLSSYSAYYYTYIWSHAIAADLYGRFERAGLRDRATAIAYREKVLAPGGSKPAADLVQDFLGRPLSLDAYRTRLAKGG